MLIRLPTHQFSLRSWGGGGPRAQVIIPGLVLCLAFTWLVPALVVMAYWSVVIPG